MEDLTWLLVVKEGHFDLGLDWLAKDTIFQLLVRHDLFSELLTDLEARELAMVDFGLSGFRQERR